MVVVKEDDLSEGQKTDPIFVTHSFEILLKYNYSIH